MAEREKLLMLTFTEMRSSDAWIVMTDTDGSFAIKWDIVPVGGGFESANEFGYTVWNTISDSVTVCAWTGGAGASEYSILKPGHTIDVDIVLRGPRPH